MIFANDVNGFHVSECGKVFEQDAVLKYKKIKINLIIFFYSNCEWIGCICTGNVSEYNGVCKVFTFCCVKQVGIIVDADAIDSTITCCFCSVFTFGSPWLNEISELLLSGSY